MSFRALWAGPPDRQGRLTYRMNAVITRLASRDGGPPSLGAGRRVAHLRDLLLALVGRDLKVRYKRSVLGMAWSLVNPLAQLLVFVFVFGNVLDLGGPRYAALVFTGVLAWSWFASSITQGAGVIVDNRQLIRRPGFPSAILPVVAVCTNLLHFLLALPVLLVFALVDGSRFGWSLLLLPVAAALLT